MNLLQTVAVTKIMNDYNVLSMANNNNSIVLDLGHGQTIRVWDNGDKYWYQNGKPHREDGPASEYANGDKVWYQNGKPHREDGPACEWANGDKVWYLNDERMSQQDHAKAMALLQKKRVA